MAGRVDGVGDCSAGAERQRLVAPTGSVPTNLGTRANGTCTGSIQYVYCNNEMIEHKYTYFLYVHSSGLLSTGRCKQITALYY